MLPPTLVCPSTCVILVLSHLSRLCSSSCRYFSYILKFCLLPLTLLVLSLPPDWSHLLIPTPSGTKHKQKHYVGYCQSLFGKALVTSCYFFHSDFYGFIPCGTSYHVKCIKVEPQFHSWHKPTSVWLSHLLLEFGETSSFVKLAWSVSSPKEKLDKRMMPRMDPRREFLCT